ncbi:MAG: flavodoxin domain-containing protein [Caldilineaceae bacterium]
MNTLVVYDSQYGNTAQIAKTIAQTLNEFGQAHAKPVAKANRAELQDIDLLVLGSPTQGWGATPAMRIFTANLAPELVSGLDVACFDTRFHMTRFLTGSAAHGLVRQMRKLGALLLAAPESFFVSSGEGPLEEGELSRAAQWARGLYQRIEQHSPVTHRM